MTVTPAQERKAHDIAARFGRADDLKIEGENALYVEILVGERKDRPKRFRITPDGNSRMVRHGR